MDVLTLGPRAVLGAILLAPQPNTLIEEASNLLQSPGLVPQAAEDAILACIERGATAESEAVQLALAVLPEDVRAALPASIAAPPVPAGARGAGASSSSSNGASAAIISTPLSAADLLEEESAAVELDSLRLAVSAVKEAVENVQSNADPAMRSLLMLGVREARDSLSRQLAQVSKATYAAKGVPTTSAADEATMLLMDLDTLLSGPTL